ncbi:MAG: C4-type zinc ribbon domain-containing protein [Myxococcota bacterium]
MTSQKARREALLHKIPAPLLRKYEHIRKKRAELGLTPAADGRCTACNMRLPPQLYNILQRVDTIEQCPSCQRIVFYVGILEEAENAHVGQESTAEDKTALSAEATPQ